MELHDRVKDFLHRTLEAMGLPLEVSHRLGWGQRE